MRKEQTINGLINYERSLADKHNFNILFGSERLTGDSMNFWAFRKYFVSTAVDQFLQVGNWKKIIMDLQARVPGLTILVV